VSEAEDPDRGAAGSQDPGSPDTGSARPPGPKLPQPVIDTRPYRWAIGGLGLLLVLGLSVYQFAKNGIGTAGVTSGHPLHYFVAPLSTSTLNGDANLRPRCDPAHPNPRALNICPATLARAPLVLAFFVTGSDACKHQIDTMQAVSREFPPTSVQFAAVAVRTGHREAANLVRTRGWTFPVAYDPDGAVGQDYGVSICPMLELTYRGGIVKDRLIGEHWLSNNALASQVRALVASSR
jgi:peroxiredoxin